MFIPFFIAILMGLISPANHTTNCNGGTVQVSNSGPDDPGTGDPDGDPGDTKGEPGPGGDNQHLPPPKP